MKIAVATIDGESVSQHFGQSTGFVVFDVADGVIHGRELRRPSDTPHNQGVCQGNKMSLLDGCEVMICGGMGAGASASLRSMGIRPVLMPGVLPAQEAVQMFLQGKGDASGNALCQCDHH